MENNQLLNAHHHNGLKNGEAKKLSVASLEEIKQAIRYLMVLCGLNEKDLPDEVEKAILIDFLISEYPNFTTDDLKQAFRLALSGKIKLDFEIYGKRFSAAYISRFLNAYKNYKIELNMQLKKAEASKKMLPPYQPNEQEKAQIDEISKEIQQKLASLNDKINVVHKKGFTENEQNDVLNYDQAKKINDNFTKK